MTRGGYLVFCARSHRAPMSNVSKWLAVFADETRTGMSFAVSSPGSKHMKTAIVVVALLMTFAIGSSAQEPSPPRPQPQPAPSASTAQASDSTFVMKAAHANIAEVELGKLALKKSQNDEVKKFAQRMVDDHGKAANELKAIASRKNVTWPKELDADHKSLESQLSKLSSPAFDQAYMEAMVEGHGKVAKEVRTESQSGKDPEVKAWAAKTLPTVEAHLKEAERVSGKVNPTGAVER